jgi:hypothetical protein
MEKINAHIQYEMHPAASLYRIVPCPTTSQTQGAFALFSSEQERGSQASQHQTRCLGSKLNGLSLLEEHETLPDCLFVVVCCCCC